MSPAEAGIRPRCWPWPYRAALAICSDLDETPDIDVYLESMRFLNSTRPTRMGPGVGLEVGNSLYFDMPAGQLSYWGTDDAGRAALRELLRSGHIDCLHSYGDLATTRAHAGRAVEELVRHGCHPQVWIDHATAVTNFGADIMQGQGDVPGSPAYHADLTCDLGVRYVWRGRVTSVIGQDVPRSLGGVIDAAHLLPSVRTAGKEWLKGVLARAGSVKYALHPANTLLQPAQLRDGRRVQEFLRANPHWGGVSCADNATGLADVLTPRMLDRLEARGGGMLLYTHLGKIRDAREPFGAATRAALAGLAERRNAGRILVTTTRRLLGFCHARNAVRARASGDGSGIEIEAHGVEPADLAGLCFAVADAARARLRVNGRDVAGVVRHTRPGGGAPCVSIPWPALVFPA
ncbi:MAG: hypothetical protein IT480_10815 [Gammaproteobacteria bacterium]|nr:hypothetical protein [Gammaproteobacteria bacterium]